MLVLAFPQIRFFVLRSITRPTKNDDRNPFGHRPITRQRETDFSRRSCRISVTLQGRTNDPDQPIRSIPIRPLLQATVALYFFQVCLSIISFFWQAMGGRLDRGSLLPLFDSNRQRPGGIDKLVEGHGLAGPRAKHERADRTGEPWAGK
jgi:hypothetical protein